MANAVIGFPEYSKKVIFSEVDPYEPQFEAHYPVAHLGTYDLPRVARSIGGAAAFVAELDAPRTVRMLGLCGHNFTRAGRYRIRLYADLARTLEIYDTGWNNVWPTLYSYETHNFYTPNFWYGQYSPDEMQGQYQTRALLLPKTFLAQSILVELSDGAQFDLGYFAIADAWQLGLNPGYGAQLGFENNDVAVFSAGASKYVEERPKARRFQGTIEYMNISEVKERAYEMQRQLGTHTPFLWMLDPDDDKNTVRDSYLAQLQNLGLFGLVAWRRGSVPLDLREVI